MCACPTAGDGVRAGVRGPGQRRRPARRAAARRGARRRRARSSASSARSSARRISCRRGSSAASSRISSRQHLDVEAEVPDVLVEDGQVGCAEPVERRVPGGEPCRPAAVGTNPPRQDVGVGGGLDQQPDLLAAGGRVRDRHVLVLRRDALDRPAVQVVDERLGLDARPVADEPEVEHGLHPPAGPLGGHPPVARNQLVDHGAAPRRARAERLVRGGQRLGDRHRLVRTRARRLELQRQPRRRTSPGRMRSRSTRSRRSSTSRRSSCISAPSSQLHRR